MVYKDFRLNIFIRIAVIVCLTCGLAFVLVGGKMLFVPLTIVVLLLLEILELIRYIEKSNRDLTHLLLSLRQGAFTGSYSSGNRGRHFEAFSKAMNDIISEFARLNEQKELHYQFLEALNENINVAILGFDDEGRLLMMNTAARHLLGNPALSNIEDFRSLAPTLYDTIQFIRPGQRVTKKAFIDEAHYQLSIQKKEIVLQDKPVHILLLQNLNIELEEKEIEAWHQLMNVLTHEIMNSVTPILSLTAAIGNILKNEDGTPKSLQKLNDENAADIFSSLETIESRSRGLLKFVNAYRAYAKGPEVRSEMIDVAGLIARIVGLLRPDFQKFGIRCDVKILSKPLKAKADGALIEQVLINLLKNAIEAAPHDGCGTIEIGSQANPDGGVSISVADNGHGMDPETMHRIFIPFFTTKPGGSGIGLSLSRQIMKHHHGNIDVRSTSGQGSVFTMTWS